MTKIGPPTNGTEQRLDAVLDELRAIRRTLEAPAMTVTGSESTGVVDLKEPVAATKSGGRKKGKGA